jgi:hypothetical protein
MSPPDDTERDGVREGEGVVLERLLFSLLPSTFLGLSPFPRDDSLPFDDFVEETDDTLDDRRFTSGRLPLPRFALELMGCGATDLVARTLVEPETLRFLLACC